MTRIDNFIACRQIESFITQALDSQVENFFTSMILKIHYSGCISEEKNDLILCNISQAFISTDIDEICSRLWIEIHRLKTILLHWNCYWIKATCTSKQFAICANVYFKLIYYLSTSFFILYLYMTVKQFVEDHDVSCKLMNN